jgi:WD40 repeat protein
MQRLAIPKKKRIHAIAFSPDGRDLAAVCGDGTLRVWDTTTGQLRHTLAVPQTSAGHHLLFLGPDLLLVAAADLVAYDLAAGEWKTLVAGVRWGRQVALSPDRAVAAEVESAGSTEYGGDGLVLYDTRSWTSLPDPPEARHTTGGVAFSPDGRFLATGHIVLAGTKMRSIGHGFGPFPVNAYDYVVHLRKVPPGRIIKTIPGWQQGVRFLTFSPDGSVLVGTAGPRLRVWDLAADRELACHKRGTKHFQGLAFTADGRYLATVSNDETVRLWDARTWAEKATFTWDVGRLLNIAFAPDGLRAAAGSDKGQIVLWDVDG